MNLKAERKERGLTQKELAAGAGVSAQAVADIERGAVEGARSTWARLEAFLAAPPAPERPAVVLTHDPGEGEDVQWHREQEGLTVAQMAKLMGCQKAEVEAMEAGELRLIAQAWDALERFKDTQSLGVLGGGPCGWCGKVHAFGACQR